MPLMHGKSKKTFEHNVREMYEAGHPMKQSLAAAYAEKRKGKAKGGMIDCDTMGPDEDEYVDRIMKSKKMSKGGMVANEDHGHNDDELADFSPNEFDDLALRDDEMNYHYTGENSGDDIGDAQEDHDRDDMVDRIMKQKRMKDRMPMAGYGSSGAYR